MSRALIYALMIRYGDHGPNSPEVFGLAPASPDPSAQSSRPTLSARLASSVRLAATVFRRRRTARAQPPWIGAPVVSPRGDDLGVVHDIMVATHSGRVTCAYAHPESDGETLVPEEALSSVDGEVIVLVRETDAVLVPRRVTSAA